MREAGWSGMMSLPRELHLDPDGTLRIQVLPQTAGLRAGSLPYQETLAGVLKTLYQASGEVLCTGVREREMQFTMSAGGVELLRVSYLPEKHAFLIDDKEIALQPKDMPTLHAFVDGSVVELILSDRIGYTKRFYYEGATAPDVTVLAMGAGEVKMSGWKIAPISKNRLTTPARNR